MILERSRFWQIIRAGVFSLLFVFSLLACESNDKAEDERKDVKVLNDKLMPFADAFNELLESSSDIEAFLFFSDPHLLGYHSSLSYDEEKLFDSSFKSMRAIYNYLPFSFCLCGGDWLNNSDTQDSAKGKLLYADEMMNKWFSPYYKMMGNHDTNYQGVVSETDSSRGDLPDTFINDVYYSDIGTAYYTIKGKNTLFFILDSGIDWASQIDSYRQEQIEWLVSQLLTNTESHIVIGIHMFYNGKIVMPMSQALMDICNAFNRRDVYESSFVKADFIAAQGVVHFIICGHNHMDFVYDEGDIPCVGITKFITDGQPSFDLCLVDYDSGYLNMIRVGSGNDRYIPIAQ